MRARARAATGVLLLGGVLGIAAETPALARPGGGNTYRSPPAGGASRSSGSSSSTSSGSRSSGGTSSPFAGPSRTPSLGSPLSDSGHGHGFGSFPGDHEAPEPPHPALAPLAHLLGLLSPRQLWGLGATLFAVAVFSGAFSSRREGRRALGWTTGSPHPQPEEDAALQRVFDEAHALEQAAGSSPPRPPDIEREKMRVRDVPQAIRILGGQDSDFSVPVFEDFVTALYHAANERRGNGRLAELSPYLAHSAQVTYASMPASRVDGIVVGTLSEAAVFAVTSPIREIEAQVVFSANYVETNADGEDQRYVLNELWTLLRSPDLPSRAPEKARIIGCPNCGAPVGTRAGEEPSLGDPCAHCGQVVDPGAYDWRVVDIRVRYREPAGTTAVGDVEEIGTDYATVIDPEALANLEALRTRDETQTWPAFVARVVLVFETLVAAWTAEDLTPVRPFLTDTLFDAQSKFLEANRRRGLHNHTTETRTSFIELARVTRDRHYDSITVRVHASALDFTTNRVGIVVGGSRKHRREYTEYWTFLRAAAHAGPPRVDLACPSCGATVAVNMAGRCDHCNVKITRGDFDWVLSRIEQDESYRVLTTKGRSAVRSVLSWRA